MVLRSYNPNTREAEAGELHVRGQPEPKVMGLSLTLHPFILRPHPHTYSLFSFVLLLVYS